MFSYSTSITFHSLLFFFFRLMLVPTVCCKLHQHCWQLAAETCNPRWRKFLSKESGYACRFANNEEILSLSFHMLVLCVSKANQVAVSLQQVGEEVIKCFLSLAFILIYYSLRFSLPPSLFLTAQACHYTVLETMSSVCIALKLP